MATNSKNIQVSLLLKADNNSACTIYLGRSFHCRTLRTNIYMRRIFITITNRASEVNFIVMVSCGTSTFGKLSLKKICEREIINTEKYLVVILNHEKKFSKLL